MRFKGVGVALVTPFDEHKNVDYPALERLINELIVGGVDFLVALGTTAETPTLTSQEKEEILQFIIQKNNGRKPTVCGIGGNNTQEVIEQIGILSKYPIDGILSVVPYYNKPSQEGIFQHFSAIASSTTLPIILYNVPGRTVANMLPATTLRLANTFSNIVAVKEASGSIPQCMELVKNAPEGFSILSGDDNLTLAQIAIGMRGVISVAANCYPQSFSSLVHQALEGDFAAARDIHYKLANGIDLLFAEGNPTGVKYVLERKGWMKNELRLPLIAASQELAMKLDEETTHS